MEGGSYFFTADGRILVRPAEGGQVREATKADRTEIGRALRVPRPYWQWWLAGGEPAD